MGTRSHRYRKDSGPATGPSGSEVQAAAQAGVAVKKKACGCRNLRTPSEETDAGLVEAPQNVQIHADHSIGWMHGCLPRRPDLPFSPRVEGPQVAGAGEQCAAPLAPVFKCSIGRSTSTTATAPSACGSCACSGYLATTHRNPRERWLLRLSQPQERLAVASVVVRLKTLCGESYALFHDQVSHDLFACTFGVPFDARHLCTGALDKARSSVSRSAGNVFSVACFGSCWLPGVAVDHQDTCRLGVQRGDVDLRARGV